MFNNNKCFREKKAKELGALSTCHSEELKKKNDAGETKRGREEIKM